MLTSPIWALLQHCSRMEGARLLQHAAVVHLGCLLIRALHLCCSRSLSSDYRWKLTLKIQITDVPGESSPTAAFWEPVLTLCLLSSDLAGFSRDRKTLVFTIFYYCFNIIFSPHSFSSWIIIVVLLIVVYRQFLN